MKRLVEALPVRVSKNLVRVPFSMRLGPEYGRSRRLIESVGSMSPDARKRWSFERLKSLITKCYADNEFYRTIYKRRGFHPDKFKSLAHFNDVPIVSKSDMQEFSLRDRSSPAVGRQLINTGGSSGEPLEFYVDRKAFAREWAHMHWIWQRHGYDYRQLKLTLRGKNLGSDKIHFNAVHNELVLNSYAGWKTVIAALEPELTKTPVFWVHGYPSLVADFCEHLERHAPMVLAVLKSALRGVLLGSEFPAKHYLDVIERVLGVPIVCWYGHSEMSALAYEGSSGVYVPLHSYGFCECVEVDGHNSNLIATSYWNKICPFVRYDTGDGIEAEERVGAVSRFRISSGRVGDFVLDRDGTKISLTALIFGRHHTAFKSARHVQVRQTDPGVLLLLVVPRNSDVSVQELKQGFDLGDTRLRIEIQLVDSPLLSPSGKTPLLVA